MASVIEQGSTPFWNPYHYGGHPAIADPQSFVFSPAFVIWALFDPTPSLFTFDIVVFAHLLIGGLALAWRGHSRGWPAAASILTAAIFMLGGVASSRLSHVGIITVFALAPVTLVVMERTLEKRSMPGAFSLGLLAALVALGRNQVSLLLMLTLFALFVHNVLSRPSPARFLLSRALVLAVTAVTFITIVAIPILLTLQFAEFSNRPEIALENALNSSLYPVNIANFFVPNIFGSLELGSVGDWGPGYGTRGAIDTTDRAFNYLFAGSLTALLLVWHGILGQRVFGRDRRLMIAIAVAALCYAMGRYTPLFTLMFDHLPGIAQFRRPVGASFIFIFALAWLGGALVADYVREGLPPVPRHAAVAAMCAIAALLAWAVVFSATSSQGSSALLEIIMALPVYVMLIAVLARPATSEGRAVAAGFVVLFTCGELVVRNAASSLNAEPRRNYALLESPTPDSAEVVRTIKNDMRDHSEDGVRPRVEVVGLGGPWQNAAMIFELEATNGYNPMRIGPYDRLVSPGESPFNSWHRRFPESFPGYDSRLARLLGLKYVVLDRAIANMPRLKQRPVAETLMAGPRAWVYRLEHAAPRVALDTRFKLAEADELIDAGHFPTTAESPDILIGTEDVLTQKYTSTLPSKSGAARIVGWRPDRVEIAVETSAAAVLTLHDPWYPGWQVEVDGAPSRLLRVDLLFRGVEVPAGAKTVVFTYRPLSFENLKSAALSLLGDGE